MNNIRNSRTHARHRIALCSVAVERRNRIRSGITSTLYNGEYGTAEPPVYITDIFFFFLKLSVDIFPMQSGCEIDKSVVRLGYILLLYKQL